MQFGGELAVTARAPWHSQEAEEALWQRGGGSGPAQPAGGGPVPAPDEQQHQQRPQSTQALVDKLAARHAEAQALLRQLQAAKGRPT
jgi:hypothetical protein